MAKEYIEREADGFKYYIVRNKETGLYFRGKGENKWGKYYNQASVYRIKKHAENAVEEETRRGNPTEVVEIRIVEQSAADVVEVVRCKDCAYREQLGDRLMCRRTAHKSDDGCWFGLRATASEHFCSYGERKE